MKLLPIKSGDEMVTEYEERLRHWRAVEPCTRRVAGPLLAVAYFAAFYLLCGALTILGSSEYGSGADPTMSPRQAQDSGEKYVYEP